jgi:hypothetical protein
LLEAFPTGVNLGLAGARSAQARQHAIDGDGGAAVVAPDGAIWAITGHG